MKISENTSVLVTGGASGLGLAVVEKFVSLGAKVAVFDMNEAEGSKVASQHGVAFRKWMYRTLNQCRVASVQ